jgi:hypothetical protein
MRKGEGGSPDPANEICYTIMARIFLVISSRSG